jgi:hypothetical protein
VVLNFKEYADGIIAIWKSTGPVGNFLKKNIDPRWEKTKTITIIRIGGLKNMEGNHIYK